MATATGSDSDATSRVAYRALLGSVFLVAAVTFVLSFHGLDDYGNRVAGLGILSLLVPVAVDGMTIVAVASTMLLRHAQWHVRAYAWFVFSVATGLSIGGNLAHADSRHLNTAGKVGAAASPILLALASHLVIVTRRAIEREDKRHAAAIALRQEAATEGVARPPGAATPRAAKPATPAATAPATAAAPPATRPAASPRPTKAPRLDNSDDAKARRLWSGGKSHAEIAVALGISKKTAERYTAPLRQASANEPSDDPERALVAAMAGASA